MQTLQITLPSHKQLVAFALLVSIGILVALSLSLARIIISNGWSPLQCAFWQTLGGGLLLFIQYGREDPPRLSIVNVRYFLISGLTAVALPNVIAFIVVSKIGSGLTATLYALPAILTYAFSIGLRMERFNMVRVSGILIGIIGCIQILTPATNGIDSSAFSWLLLGLLIPTSLAIGNVYRSVAWPVGAKPIQLAPGMLLGAAFLLGIALVFTGEFGTLYFSDVEILATIGLQALLTAITYRAFFELQKRSSPVFLSQIGFVVTPVGLVLGILLFNEQIQFGVWCGVGVLLTGLYLTNR